MSYLDNKGVERLWTHIVAKLGDKVNKEEGKGLSSNDFTAAEKTKLASLAAPSLTTTGAGNAVTNISVSGSTFTVEKDADFLTEHPYITKYADTSSAASPAAGETFTAVDEITRDENGHVEKINVKTVTLPKYTLTGLMGSTAKGSATLPVYWTGSAWATITSYEGVAAKVANALSINGKTYDGSAAVDVGVIDAAHGGTGKTSLLGSANALINALDNGTSTPVDADYFISQYVNGGTTTTTYHRRPMSALYDYMKGKMDSVYQAKGTVPIASSTTLGGIKVGSGLTIATDGTLDHSNSIAAKTAYGSAATTASADGGTITLTDVQYDAQGHITGSTDRTITLSQRATTLEELGIDTFDKLNTKYGLDDKYKVAPDWNESNSASKNYIDNRPGAFTKTETITLTATAEASNEEDTTTTKRLKFAFPDERMDLIPGETYQVVWGGQTYNWEAKVFYANFSTNESSTTYKPGFTSLYLICGHMPTGDATDSFPITVMSAGGSFYVTEMQKGMLLVGSNGTSFTVGTSYSITITGKFDYKLYSCNGNNIYATGIFDDATFVMAMNYTDLKTKQIDYNNLLNKPDGYYIDGEHNLYFIGNGSGTNIECWWEEGKEGLVLDFMDYKTYTITYDGTTYTLSPHITTNNLASVYELGASDYGMVIGKISLLDKSYIDNDEETACPFVIFTQLMTGEVRVKSSSAFSSGRHQITIKGTLVCRHLNAYKNASDKYYPKLFFDNFTYKNFFTKTWELEQRFTEYVSKAGDTMYDALDIQGAYYPSLNLVPTTDTSKIKKAVFEGSYAGSVSISAWEDYSGQNRRILEVRAKSYENSLDSALRLRVCDNNNWSDYKVFHSGTTVPITSGGTGATTAAGALTALGAFPVSGGTLTGAAMAGADAQKTLSTAQLRNITISTTDLVEGESTLAEGEIYLVYDGGEA